MKIVAALPIRLVSCHRRDYERFKDHHYLAEPLGIGCQCFLIVCGKVEVGFIALLPQASRGFHRSKRISRLVVLPNYEGLGIGRRILNAMGRYFDRQGFALRICTQSADMFRLLRRARWHELHYRRSKDKAAMKTFLYPAKNAVEGLVIYTPDLPFRK